VPGSSLEREDVIVMLKALPNVGSIWEPYDGTVSWFWKQWPWEYSGYNAVDWRQGKVDMIRLSIAFELAVKDILDKYGFPEAVLAIQSHVSENPYVDLVLFYPTRGMVLRTMVFPDYAPILEPTSRVFEANYTVTESINSWMESLEPAALQPWPGYGELEGVVDPLSP
jgi:hypothetical protein